MRTQHLGRHRPLTAVGERDPTLACSRTCGFIRSCERARGSGSASRNSAQDPCQDWSRYGLSSPTTPQLLWQKEVDTTPGGPRNKLPLPGPVQHNRCPSPLGTSWRRCSLPGQAGHALVVREGWATQSFKFEAGGTGFTM